MFDLTPNSKDNGSSLVFTDISSEQYRAYTFSTDYKVIINRPTHLHVSSSGGHRILDADGVSHYIPKGWRHLEWKAKDGEPRFVK